VAFASVESIEKNFPYLPPTVAPIEKGVGGIVIDGQILRTGACTARGRRLRPGAETDGLQKEQSSGRSTACAARRSRRLRFT
jgi:hypothetical protein